jgi:hypothetical protein
MHAHELRAPVEIEMVWETEALLRRLSSPAWRVPRGRRARGREQREGGTEREGGREGEGATPGSIIELPGVIYTSGPASPHED